MNRADFQLLELNGGLVTFGTTTTCWLPPVPAGYADAQFDDYAGDGSGLWGWGHGRFRWHPGLTLSLRARFSHEADRLVGTAGFGFWNSPFGDPSVPRPALPQATWFFFASEPSNLPLPLEGPGRGWFAATVDAGQRTAVSLIPLRPRFLKRRSAGSGTAPRQSRGQSAPPRARAGPGSNAGPGDQAGEISPWQAGRPTRSAGISPVPQRSCSGLRLADGDAPGARANRWAGRADLPVWTFAGCKAPRETRLDGLGVEPPEADRPSLDGRDALRSRRRVRDICPAGSRTAVDRA